jgi:urease accessory protein
VVNFAVVNQILLNADVNGKNKDVIILDWEERRKSRQRVISKGGIEIGIALPTGTILYNGDILYKDDTTYIEVEAKKEDIILIKHKDLVASSNIAYEIGNKHLPAAINKDGIFMLYSPQTEAWLNKKGTEYYRIKTIFEPLTQGHAHIHER